MGHYEESFDFVRRSYESHKIHTQKQQTIDEITSKYTEKILNVNGPIEIIAQSILQIAKQGLSSTYASKIQNIFPMLSNLPRKILTNNGDTIKKNRDGLPTSHDINIIDVIWQGRNQSLHFEDTPHQNVIDIFDPLKIYFSNLDGYDNKENKAFEVVSKVLKWDDYDTYFNDIQKIV